MSLSSRLFMTAYGGLWRAAEPLLKRHRRLREGFDQRLVPSKWPGSSLPRAAATVWIQAASGGEALIAEALAASLDRLLCDSFSAAPPDAPNSGQNFFSATDAPLLEVVCTTCTRQGLEVLQRAAVTPLPGLRLTPAYFPLDVPGLMERALDRIAPDAVVLLETELWPGLLFAARERNIPIMVLNGRMTDKSASAYKLLRGFFAAHGPCAVLATTPENARRFAALFPHAQVDEMPNIKFDIASRLLGLENTPGGPSPQSIAGMAEDTPVALLASVREEEEEALAPAVRRIIQSDTMEVAPLVVVAPRHLHRAGAWMERLASLGVSAVLRSVPAQGKKARVVVWDAFGELLHLYASSDAVFVGGSFAPLGGQNFLEPLALGKRPFVGPSTSNFSWVGKEIEQDGLVETLSSPDQLAPSMLERLRAAGHGEEDPAAVRRRFAEWLSPRTGGADQAAERLWRELDFPTRFSDLPSLP